MAVKQNTEVMEANERGVKTDTSVNNVDPTKKRNRTRTLKGKVNTI